MKRGLLLALLLAGCGGQWDPMKYNDDNIKIHEKCKAAGLDTDVSMNGTFICRPKK